jgi:hypothetical protein
MMDVIEGMTIRVLEADNGPERMNWKVFEKIGPVMFNSSLFEETPEDRMVNELKYRTLFWNI